MSIRIFKTARFAKWAKREKLPDLVLVKSVTEITDGLIEASLGSGLLKKRLAKGRAGKRGGYRTILAFRAADKAVFLFGFAKNEQSDLAKKDVAMYKEVAKKLLSVSSNVLDRMCANGDLEEITQ